MERPKPGDLSMSRMKLPEAKRSDVKRVGDEVERGEIPIEPGDSWFSRNSFRAEKH